MRLAGFVLLVLVILPATIGATDTIGNVSLTVFEDGASRMVIEGADTQIICFLHKQCGGEGCTPVPTATVQFKSESAKLLVSIAMSDPTTAGTTLVARSYGSTPEPGFANVTVQTPSAMSWPIKMEGSVRIDRTSVDLPLHIAVTLTGITDGTRTLDGTIECPDEFVPPLGSGGGGCGGGGGGGGGDGIDD